MAGTNKHAKPNTDTLVKQHEQLKCALRNPSQAVDLFTFEYPTPTQLTISSPVVSPSSTSAGTILNWVPKNASRSRRYCTLRSAIVKTVHPPVSGQGPDSAPPHVFFAEDHQKQYQPLVIGINAASFSNLLEQQPGSVLCDVFRCLRSGIWSRDRRQSLCGMQDRCSRL